MYRDRAWPVAPRPLPLEVFGSWLGRVAARYRIGVDDLVAAAAVDIELGTQANHWLAARPISGDAVSRLGHLARLSREEVERTLRFAGQKAEGYPCCFTCLVLNPWEVESPYWRLEWMSERSICEHDNSSWERASPGLLKQAKNMSQLVGVLSRRRQMRAGVW